MSGRSRLPSGAPRRIAGHSRLAVSAPTVATAREPRWRPGDRVVWRDCTGQYLREVEDGQAHVLIGARTYFVAVGELRPG